VAGGVQRALGDRMLTQTAKLFVRSVCAGLTDIADMAYDDDENLSRESSSEAVRIQRQVYRIERRTCERHPYSSVGVAQDYNALIFLPKIDRNMASPKRFSRIAAEAGRGDPVCRPATAFVELRGQGFAVLAAARELHLLSVANSPRWVR